MAPPNTFYHALLRPCILQILRAAGYQSAKVAVVDALTELAARHMLALCHAAAMHAEQNDSLGIPTVVDVRMALQDVGALAPERHELEQEYTGVEDMRGVEALIDFASSRVCSEIKRIALEGEDDAKDYLSSTSMSLMGTGWA
jgi:transcription initiation factor TFIID subunit 3